MGQYYPAYRAYEFADLQQGLKQSEYELAAAMVEDIGFENVYLQEAGSSDEYTPDFT
jgi:putative pyruvate formate lyase activating enzyme